MHNINKENSKSIYAANRIDYKKIINEDLISVNPLDLKKGR